MGFMDIANQLAALASQGQKQGYDEFGPEKAQNLQQAGIDAAGATVGSTKGVLGGLVPDAAHLAAYEKALARNAGEAAPELKHLIGTNVDLNGMSGTVSRFARGKKIGPNTLVEVDVKGTPGWSAPLKDLLNKAKPRE